MPDINTDPTSRNIYGISERILLTWLNYCYSNYLEQVWEHIEQYLQNALIIISCLLQLGIEYDLQALDITRADPICMCLLVCYLYEHLPDYLSKGIVQFGGILHESSISQVKITNPSTQTLVYS